MNIGMLATLSAILERGSFAAAADEVGCTPSAVSLQVKQLEGYFGRPLFDRSGRSVKPTAFALKLGVVADELVEKLDALRQRPHLAVAGRVRLGAIATIQTDALPRALRALRERHPALDVEVTLNDSDELLAELKAGRVDAAALVRPAGGSSSRLVWQDLARQPYVLLAPADAPALGPHELLQQLGWIRYDPALTGGRIAARYVRRAYPKARCVMQLRAIDAIVAMVSAGLGVTVVPQPRKPLLDAHAIRELRLGRDAPFRQLTMVRRGTDADDRNLAAVFGALAGAFDTPPTAKRQS